MIKTLFAVFLTVAIVVAAPKIKHYSQEVDELAAVINSECSNCSETEQYLVGSVVLNRCNSAAFPSEINHVIVQANQFHGVGTKHFHPTAGTRKVAADLLSGKYITPEIIYFCTYSSKPPMDTVLVWAEKHIFGK